MHLLCMFYGCIHISEGRLSFEIWLKLLSFWKIVMFWNLLVVIVLLYVKLWVLFWALCNWAWTGGLLSEHFIWLEFCRTLECHMTSGCLYLFLLNLMWKHANWIIFVKLIFLEILEWQILCHLFWPCWWCHFR